MTQQQYISNWHDSFVDYVKRMLVAVLSIERFPQLSEADRQGLGLIKALFSGKDVQEIERDLANGIIKQSTLDKIEMLNKNVIDIAIDHFDSNPVVKEFLKQLCYMKVESDKTMEMMRLASLGVLVDQRVINMKTIRDREFVEVDVNSL